MGIQSGSERTKGIYHRRHSNEQILKSARIISEFNDDVDEIMYDIILDNPWEADAELAETLMFLTSLPVPYTLNLFSLSFYPATELY